MAKQLLIYESAVPVSATRHRDASFDPGQSYAFSAEVNAVPLMAVEMLAAATEYAIVFVAVGEDVLPAAVLGLKPQQNLYLSSEARWQAKYVPAFIRRYPFVFAASEDRTTLTLCIDEAHPGVNSEGRGHRLFTEDGKPSPYVEQVMRFLKEYQAQFERTRALGRRLKELGLLEPMQAQVTIPAGEKIGVGGFMVVPRPKLRALAAESLAELAKTDELELLYLHLYSLRNFNLVKDRLLGTLGIADPAVMSEPSPLVQ